MKRWIRYVRGGWVRVGVERPFRHALHALTLACCMLSLAAHGAITPISSSLAVSSVSDLDPDDVDTPVSGSDSSGPLLKNFSLASSASDSLPPALTQTVTANASVSYAGVDTVTVHFLGARAGSDSSFGPPGGQFASRAEFRMEFENLDVAQVSVAWSLAFERDYNATIAPFGIGLRRIGILDSRSPTVPFSALNGVASGIETFDLDRTGPGGIYTLELDLHMVGTATNVAPAETWDATFVVTTPTMTITPVPEPGPAALLLTGLAVFALRKGTLIRTRPRTRP